MPLVDDFFTLKYKDGYEQGKLEGSMIPYEEPQKVTIPQFVADYIEFQKTYNFHVYGAMRTIEDYQDKKVPERKRAGDFSIR